MADQPRQVGGGRRAIGDIAPKLAALTDDVLFDDVWNRPELSARDRSLITVTALIAGGHSDQLPHHLGRALENGITRTELIEAITHLASTPAGPTPCPPPPSPPRSSTRPEPTHTERQTLTREVLPVHPSSGCSSPNGGFLALLS